MACYGYSGGGDCALPPSSSGPGLRPFKPPTGVRVPLGAPVCRDKENDVPAKAKPKRQVKPKPQIDYSKLGTLRDKVKPGTPPFDIRKLRDEGYDPALYRE